MTTILIAMIFGYAFGMGIGYHIGRTQRPQ